MQLHPLYDTWQLLWQSMSSPSCFPTALQATHIFFFITLITMALAWRHPGHRSSQAVSSPGHHLRLGVSCQMGQPKPSGAAGTSLSGWLGDLSPRRHWGCLWLWAGMQPKCQICSLAVGSGTNILDYKINLRKLPGRKTWKSPIYLLLFLSGVWVSQTSNDLQP